MNRLARNSALGAVLLVGVIAAPLLATGQTVTSFQALFPVLSQDVGLYRESANTLAVRNGTNAQAVNIYNTTDGGSNYERGYATWSGNTFRIGTGKSGTGTARALSLETDSTARWIVSTGGNLSPQTSNTVDLGATANRVRNVYIGTRLSISPVTVATLPSSPADGDRSFVTDATACTFATAVTGSGALHCPVYYDGGSSSWKAG